MIAYVERNDGSRIRLRSMSAGAILGEMGVYTGGPRTASVVADQACIVHRLTDGALQRMNAEQPSWAHVFTGSWRGGWRPDSPIPIKCCTYDVLT